MGLIKKAFGFIASPSHSRTMALVGMLVLVSAVFLTVNQNQQQQTLKQRAAETKGYAPCDEGLNWKCGDTTVGADCGSGEYKCYSQNTIFYTSDKINNKYLACCRGTGYGLVNGTCTLVKGDVETVACTPPPPVTSGDYSQCAEHLDDCGPATVGADCGSGKIKCIARTGYTDSSADSIDRHPLVCCTQPIVPAPAATDPDPTIKCGTSGNGICSYLYCRWGTNYGNTDCNKNTNNKTCCEPSKTETAPAAPAAPDNVPPTVYPIVPLTATVGTAQIFATQYISDNVGVTSCNLFVDGVNVGTMDVSSGTAAWKSYTFTSVGSNPHSLYAKCSDAAGNKADGAPTQVTVSAATPNLFTCQNQTGEFAGNYQCKTIINGTTQCDSGFAAYSPSAPYTGVSCGTNQGCCKQGPINQANLFTCQNQTGEFAGNYQCKTIINGTTQCPSSYTAYSPSDSFTGTSCGTNQGCCKQDAAIPTATPTPTPIPANTVTLGLTFNPQDAPTTSDPITATLSLYDFATDKPVTGGTPPTQSFVKTPKQYSASIPLSNVVQGKKYYIVARYNSMIAKSPFTVSGTGEIPAPTTTLVFGDLNNDNSIDILDYRNVFGPCWLGKLALSSCTSSDFYKTGKAIDQVGFTTFIKGWNTWINEGKL